VQENTKALNWLLYILDSFSTVAYKVGCIHPINIEWKFQIGKYASHELCSELGKDNLELNLQSASVKYD
jgi:hypothetical protein